MPRRTKIVATVGPASDSIEVLVDLIEAGVDVFRLGLAHDDVESVVERMERIREAGRIVGRTPGILADLPGPKVRAGSFGDEAVKLEAGTLIDVIADDGDSDAGTIRVDYKRVAEDVLPGDTLVLGDGKVILSVIEIVGSVVKTQVMDGGRVRGRPGVHIPSERLQVSTPTAEDLVALDVLVEAGVDMVAVSFVKCARDLRALGVEKRPKGPLVVAKIETRAAIDNLDSILEVSNAVMVARGDLGLECPIAELPTLQKSIIAATVQAGLPVITATQMLESMTEGSQPTRAEVTDVANAVFDGTSAVMLSGETAIGVDPARVVRTMEEILINADGAFDREGWWRRFGSDALHEDLEQSDPRRITDAVSAAANRAIAALAPKAVVCVTGSGNTARAISRFRPKPPIIAVTDNARTAAQLTLSWGVRPLFLQVEGEEGPRISSILGTLRDSGKLEVGDIVPVIAGSSSTSAASNILRVERVPPA